MLSMPPKKSKQKAREKKPHHSKGTPGLSQQQQSRWKISNIRGHFTTSNQEERVRINNDNNSSTPQRQLTPVSQEPNVDTTRHALQEHQSTTTRQDVGVTIQTNEPTVGDEISPGPSLDESFIQSFNELEDTLDREIKAIRSIQNDTPSRATTVGTPKEVTMATSSGDGNKKNPPRSTTRGGDRKKNREVSGLEIDMKDPHPTTQR